MKKGSYYTFTIARNDSNHEPLSICVPYFVVRYFLLVSIILVTAFSFSLLYSTFLSGKLVHYKMVVDAEAEKDKQINIFAGETHGIKKELQSLLDQNNQLRRVLGLKIEKTKINFDKEITKKTEKPLSYGLTYKFKQISDSLNLSFKEADDVKVELEELKKRVAEIQSRMEVTPSIWPIRGRISSFFGYRWMPWRGFHAGVDIQANYGTQIKVTADGIVTYAGWRQGYGKLVIVSHGHGFFTWYGHASKLDVIEGEKVRKGGIVAYVGSTGYSTGPHLHYEVRKNDMPINPVAFLDLDVLSASRFF
ncbi:hypothetical protein A3J90_01475 [candidate division WOR-1 bacterium RIFOXYC2_FULL_37_10]|uniref:M23ase beta-sheet core domain-containing protein n=1 Tax=candidate division WOR-1 bacterium RIFOXYB2_FULL_37_13 TaxID=1802579 RepID=A0A1F4SEY9_UNCSA|nr:MAG: hypothetical protein A2310_06350 [candidate division WOR-1 bacterium RIFOXYB2_FULL_37_13]OGC35782.1 MAG: hypothetical protein A3J90_01475 [candidate division WOR-1 bacterium RIFOXYC2_FULL_37_10]